MGGWRTLALRCLSLVVFLAVWEIGCRWHGSDALRMAAPSRSLHAFWEMTISGELLRSSLASVKRVLVGFSLALISGVVIGFLVGRIRAVAVTVQPALELLRPIPPIAWIPVALAVFHLGDPAAYFVIFIGGFYPIMTNVAAGAANVDRNLIDAAKSLGAGRLRTLAEVVWPSTLVHLMAGVAVGVGFAWMCVCAAEMIGAQSGLGYTIQLYRQLLRLDRVVAGMVAIGLIGFAMSRIVVAVERFALPWKSDSQVHSPKVASPHIYASPTASAISPDRFQALLEQAGISNVEGMGISAEDLSYFYAPSIPVLSKVCLNIRPGERFGIIGESGAGKTTLLKLLCGVKSPQSGRILVNGQPLNAHVNDIAMIFQSLSLFPFLTALQNISFSVRSRGYSRREARGIASEFLELVGLRDRADFYPDRLSGGQQQRVAFVRALAFAPSILLMDEPYSALDAETRERVRADFLELLDTAGLTVLLVNHDISETILLSDRVSVMRAGTGQLTPPVEICLPQPRSVEVCQTPEFLELRERLATTMRKEFIGSRQKGVEVHG